MIAMTKIYVNCCELINYSPYSDLQRFFPRFSKLGSEDTDFHQMKTLAHRLAQMTVKQQLSVQNGCNFHRYLAKHVQL